MECLDDYRLNGVVFRLNDDCIVFTLNGHSVEIPISFFEKRGNRIRELHYPKNIIYGQKTMNLLVNYVSTELRVNASYACRSAYNILRPKRQTQQEV